MADADKLVERFVLSHLDDGHHLKSCSERTIDYYTRGSQSDTGAEYAKLEAEVSCSHKYTEEIEYGEWGDSDSIIETLSQWADEGEI